MASEYYIVDTTRKRRLMLGKVTGMFLHQWMLDRESFDVREIVQAFVDFGERDSRERRYDFDPGKFRRFAVKVWAFCALAGWFHEVRWASHDYDDEYLPVDHQWGASKLDPAWKTVGSWYSRDDLDVDPFAAEMGRLEKAALLAAEMIHAKEQTFGGPDRTLCGNVPSDGDVFGCWNDGVFGEVTAFGENGEADTMKPSSGFDCPECIAVVERETSG